MARVDKYGRGSAAANGEGFVDLVPGDTFAALEAQLKRRIADRFDNPVLGISASIGSKRNASELAKHLASGEEEEVHKFAAKNIGVLFARGQIGISHDDKKAVDETREKPRILRVFSAFEFAGSPLIATITIKPSNEGMRLYAIEALDIMRDESLEVHLAAKPRQFKTTRLLLENRISYYVGDVNRTRPKFVSLAEPFTIERTVELLEGNMRDFCASHQPPTTNHQPPKFSIIIPVYNVAPYLRECLDSVLAQTFTDWEAICVDDGSMDCSGAILDEYAARDPRFRVICQQNAGVARAREVGLTAAHGEYVGWVDSDDVIEPWHYENLLRVAEDGDCDLVWSDHILEKTGCSTVVSHACAENPVELLSEILRRKQMGSLWDKVFRRAFVEKLGANFGVGKCAIMEDNYFLAQCLIARPKIKHVNAATYHYFVRNGSLSNKGGKTFWWQQVIDANNAIYDLLHGRFDESVLRWRMGLFKSWMVFEPNVTDEMFYGFHPEVKWLPRGICGPKGRMIFFLASIGFRKCIRMAWRMLHGRT